MEIMAVANAERLRRIGALHLASLQAHPTTDIPAIIACTKALGGRLLFHHVSETIEHQLSDECWLFSVGDSLVRIKPSSTEVEVDVSSDSAEENDQYPLAHHLPSPDNGCVPSFLHPLASFAPRPGRAAMEDFFTEAFAGVLRADPRLLPRIIRAGEEQCHRRLEPGCNLSEPDHVVIETQYWMERGRPDLVALVAGKPALIIESKFHAPFTDRADENEDASCREQNRSQIPRYIAEVRERGWRAKVLLISLWPRQIDGPLDRNIYIGNLLWSDVYSALTHAEPSNQERARVLRSELLALMEDLGMTPTQPLRFGDGQAFWAYQEVMQRMSTLLDRVATEISKEYKVNAAKERDGKAYTYFKVALPNLVIDFGLIFGDREETNNPVWPFIHVRPEVPTGGDAALHVDLKKRAHEALAANFNGLGSGWPGQTAIPTHDEMGRFLGAWEWEQQVSECLVIIRGWFEKLVGAELIERTASG